MQTSTDTLLRTLVIQQNLLMNLKERKSGNGKKNTKRHLKNLRTKLQVNQYLLFQRGKENLEWKYMLQDMQLERSYLKNKREDINLLSFYQE